MTPEQRLRVRELFEAAIDRDPADIGPWIDREAADDPIVRGEVRSLLDHHSRAGDFLAAPAVEHVPDLMVEDEPLAPGTVVGSYTIQREVGRGGMGRVYVATDTRLGREVALKVLAPHLVHDRAGRERLRREARAAANLSHPGICTVYALEEIGDELYIATEFIDGRTLRDEIAWGRRPTAEAVLETARELAAALGSAHAHGVVHRDLKPENVMRTRDGRLKILDFGLARVEVPAGVGQATRMTLPATIVGTPGYMAPEQLSGQTADARADVFAFGVLLYEYACGVHPFDAPTALATIARVLESEARPIGDRTSNVTLRVAEVIDRCLRKAPSERFSSAAAIVTALASAGDPRRGMHSAWWRTHQYVIGALYIAAAILSWQIKAWFETPFTLGLFLALGAVCTIGCVLRGHLIFTSWMNRPHLASERRRTRGVGLLVDLLVAGLLALDALIVAQVRALPAVIALSLGLCIAMAALVLEPATTKAVFGEDR
jgi:serine/threonine-protein kinase